MIQTREQNIYSFLANIAVYHVNIGENLIKITSSDGFNFQAIYQLFFSSFIWRNELDNIS